MADSTVVTLMEAARRYLETLSEKERVASQAEVQRFVRWCGADRHVDQIRGQEVANYAETLPNSLTDAASRASDVKAFLSFLKQGGHTSTNLGTHLRLRKAGPKKSPPQKARKEIQLTVDDRASKEAELESLKAQRPRIQQDLERAMADKDFRENAPLDAVRQQKAYIEGRIMELEATLDRAVTIESKVNSSDGSIAVGATVRLRNLRSDREVAYTLVWPGDVDAAQGKISVESPVGQALLKRRPGDEIEVSAPSGTLHFRIEQVDG